MRFLRAYPETFSVDIETATAVSHSNLMVGAERLLEETFYQSLVITEARKDGEQQVCVVQGDACRLLALLFALAVDHVYESCVGQELEVVHYGGAAGLYVGSQLTHVGSHVALGGQHVDEFLQLVQVFQFNLLDEQDVHFHHHVHYFQQVLCEIGLLEEEGVVSVAHVGT